MGIPLISQIHILRNTSSIREQTHILSRFLVSSNSSLFWIFIFVFFVISVSFLRFAKNGIIGTHSKRVFISSTLNWFSSTHSSGIKGYTLTEFFRFIINSKISITGFSGEISRFFFSSRSSVFRIYCINHRSLSKMVGFSRGGHSGLGMIWILAIVFRIFYPVIMNSLWLAISSFLRVNFRLFFLMFLSFFK